MRNYLPTLIFFLAATALLIVFPVVGTIAMLGTAAFVGVNIFRGARDMYNSLRGRTRASNGRGASRSQQMRSALSRGKYYSRRQGWDLDRIPVDLKPTLKGSEMFLSKPGLPTEIRVSSRRDGTADFSFPIYANDMEAARRVSTRISQGVPGASITRTGAGFMVSATEVGSASELLSVAFPLKKTVVEKEMHSVNQYVIDGCSSFDEAMKKYRKMKSEGTLGMPSNSCVYEVSDVAGIKETIGSAPWSPTTMKVGSWLINDEKVDAVKGTVLAYGTTPRSIADSALASFDATLAQGVPSKSVESQISNGGEDVRVRTLPNSEGEQIALVKAASLPEGLTAVCRCSSLEDFVDIMNSGTIPEGRFLEAGGEGRLGELDLCIPVDSEVVSRLMLQGEASAAQSRSLAVGGLSEDDLVASEVSDAVRRGGVLTLKAKEGLGFEGATVGGVPVKELSDRLSNPRLEQMDAEAARQWLMDASKIQAVSMTVDTKNMELRITSQVNDTVKCETRKLTEDDVRSLEKRGRVNKSEMKDMLMQMHPDFFDSYSAKRGNSVADPVRDFIAGRQPVTTNQVRANYQNTLKQQQPVKAEAAKRQIHF